MEELKEKFAEWTRFTDTREKARAKAMNPEGAQELREKIDDAKAAVLRAKAELQMLQAQLVLSGNGATPYTKAQFDHQWAAKKAVLKEELEAMIAQQIQAGVPIPKLMKTLGSKNTNFFYQIKENIGIYRDADKEDVEAAEWQWSDATSVHRYALAPEPGKSGFTFVLLKGSLDTDFEHEQCIYDFKTGFFISGNRALYDSVTPSVRKQRAQLLADILMGVYSKSIKRDNNPYFTN